MFNAINFSSIAGGMNLAKKQKDIRVQLLCGFDGGLNDESIYSNAYTQVGATTDGTPTFGTGALTFPSKQSNINYTLPSATNGDFTLDFMYKGAVNNLYGGSTLIPIEIGNIKLYLRWWYDSYGENHPLLQIDGTTLLTYRVGSTSIHLSTSNGNIAFTKYGNTFSLYSLGSRIVSYTSNATTTYDHVKIIRENSATASIDNLRFIAGKAISSGGSSFPVPSEAYTGYETFL